MAYLKPGAEIPEKGNGSKLRGKMLLFVEHYLTDANMNPAEAVRLAGYQARKGNEHRIAIDLMRHPLVVKAIEEGMKERKERMGLSADYVLTKLMDIVNNTESDNPQAALRGLELLGKHLGLYKDRQEISGPDGGAIEHEQRIKEDVADFTGKLASLVSRGGESTVVEFPKRKGASGA